MMMRWICTALLLAFFSLTSDALIIVRSGGGGGGGGGGGVVASDDFTDTTGTALSTHDANWTVHAATYEIEANQLEGTALSTQGLAFYDATYTNDQYAQVTWTNSVANGIFWGPAVRVQAGTASGYDCVADVDTVALREWTAGSPSDLTTTARTQSVGETIRLEASGTGLSCLIDDVEVLSTTDATHTSGNAGVGSFSGSNTILIDNWEGGNL